MGTVRPERAIPESSAVVHGILDVACRRLYGCPLVDTLELERRALDRRGTVPAAGALRLAALREHYGLPRYGAHDALSDAIGAGELLLAQIAHRATARPLRLAELVRAY